MSSAIRELDGLTLRHVPTAEEKLNDGSSYSNLLRDCISKAISKGASDIHFEPRSFGLQIRLRVNGDAEVYFSTEGKGATSMQKSVREGVAKTIKWIADIPLGFQGKAQGGRISLPTQGTEVRVSKIPVVHGEKFVFRLIDKNKSISLSDIDFAPETESDLRKAIAAKSGLILITGATGSGKSTTICSLIEEMDRRRLNISTLEDPIEREIENVNHTSVSKSLSFSDGLRELMRQDPDVIMVGEIRDAETAKLAVRLATTGHLVISTMHTDSALRVADTFFYYGVEKWLVNECLLLVANQLLVKELCSRCSKKKTKGKSILGYIPEYSGCEKCEGGFSGKRVLIFEYYTKDDVIEDVPRLRVSKNEILKELIKKGVISASTVLY